jgi:type I restriction-modification system DNA methylase subunit
VLTSPEDYHRVVGVFQSQNFTSDVLSAHFAISQAIELLKSDSGDGLFINRGLFSNYFIRERLKGALAERKRSVSKEASAFLAKFRDNALTAHFDSIAGILEGLGYAVTKSSPQEYLLSSGTEKLETVVIATDSGNLDVMRSDDRVVPSYQAVAALKKYPWVILTNGRLWRLYSARTSSASTNYFEIDIESITDEKDPRLELFVSFFGSAALHPRQGRTDLDMILEGGEEYAESLEDNLQEQVFDGNLFLDLVRAVLGHKHSARYTDEELAEAKKKALKLLYRLLFILYAESRKLLPVRNQNYAEVSLGSVRERLAAMEKDPGSQSCWKALRRLFRAISEGDPGINMPQYNGALFELDAELDRLEVANKHLVPALRALMEIDGKSIDYQNLSVRHLGSLYESLLEYSVKQAATELAVVKGEYIDMSFTKDLKGKYDSIIDRGELYLSAGGLARKGTGSYYTPEKIVRFLVKKGLEPILADREKKFLQELERWRKTGDSDAGELATKHLLDIRVVDPAMGSGHFLVAVVNEITMWIVGLLDRNPDAPLAREIGEDRQRIIDEQAAKGIEIDTELLTFNVILKRMVMKRCVYGVDINPLAVELAKLSLWLDSFTIGTPLTFLDHHIRAGDSLIGLWMQDLKARKPDNTTLDAWTESVDSIGNIMQQVSYPVDLNVDEVKRSKENYGQFREASKPLRTLLDMKAAGIVDEELEKRMPHNLPMVEEAVRNDKLGKVVWAEPIRKAIEYSDDYQFFHWELEFPDAFVDKIRGFDLVIMNPPWKIQEKDDDEFFSQYHSQFRQIDNKKDKEAIEAKILKDKSILSRFNEYVRSFDVKSKFYSSSDQYKMQSGKTDTWKLFLERAFSIISSHGTISCILPSGIVTNEGAKQLRKVILEKKIRCFLEFENRKKLFDIDERNKFVLLVVDSESSAHAFEAAFYLHDMDALEKQQEREKFVNIERELIQLISPDTLSIPEVRGKAELKILEKIYRQLSLLSKGVDSGNWTFRFVEEMNRGTSSKLFNKDGKGWNLIEGKHFHQFIPDFEKPNFTIKIADGLKWTSRIREYGSLNDQVHDVPRLSYRDVASSTNLRTMIACIMPKNTFNSDKAPLVIPRYKDKLILDKSYSRIICYMCGILNSMTFDFLVRQRVTSSLSFFLLYQTPIPNAVDTFIAKEIIRISARLSCTIKELESLAKDTGVQSGMLTIKERLDLTAKLDALVAHHYSLTREEYMHIINTFNGFDEDENLVNRSEIEWDDAIVRKLNGEVRKRSMKFYDEISVEFDRRKFQ